MEQVTLGVVHGRFQPSHNGHIRYILAALIHAEHILIGISTPKLCTEEEALKTGYPCTPALNPFTREEREGMIRAALEAEAISRDRYSFVAFPSDYVGLESIIPKNAVFFMSVTSSSDMKKIAYIESLGYLTETVMEIPETEPREHSGTVRESVKTKTEDWKNLIPESVRTYMESHDLLKKLQ